MPPKRKQSDEKPSQYDLNEDQQRAVLKFLIEKAPSEYSAKQQDTKTKDNRQQLNLFDHHKSAKDYSPFQILTSCILMSKPLSSRLATRALATLYKDGTVDTPGKLRDQGTDGLWNLLDQARTQHKGKTAQQLVELAEQVIEKYAEDENDTSLEKIRKESGDPGKVEKLVKEFNGIGQVGADIFSRRMQAHWDFLYPAADDRCLAAAGHFNLADSAEDLADVVKALLPTESEDEERKQFSAVVDLLVAADLEHRLDDLIEAAMEANSNKKLKSA